MKQETQTLTIDILVNAIRINEATGDHTIALARTLIAQNHRVRIFAETIGTLPDDIRPLASRADAQSYQADADLLIIQYAVWHPLAEVLRTCRTASIFYYHGVTPPEHFADSAMQAAQRNSRLRADLVFGATCAVCTSPYTAQELSNEVGYPLERIQVIPLPFDGSPFATPMAPALLTTLYQKLQLEGKRVLLYVGRISEHKRIDLLIDAFAILKAEFLNLHLLIVGNLSASAATRSLAEALSTQTAQRNISDAVTFTGAVDSVIPYYQMAEIYVQPSQHEGFCVPLLEAMAAGVPIVASNAGAMPWLLQAAQNGHERDGQERDGQERNEQKGVGLIFQSGNLDALTFQLRQLLSDANLHSALKKRGSQRVLDFTPERFAQNIHQAVEHALNSKVLQKSMKTSHSSHLLAIADVALRDYKVQSAIPLFGRWIAWIRRNSTSHLKEAYLDLIVEQQVNYNRQMAQEIERLQAQVDKLQSEIATIRNADAGEDEK